MAWRWRFNTATHSGLTAAMFAVVLVAAQLLLAVHDATPHIHDDAPQCQICAHGFAGGHGLLDASLGGFTRVSNKRPHVIRVNFSISRKDRAPSARAPPAELSLTIST